MMPPRRCYTVLAFLPLVLALVTLIALYTYQKGEPARRESRQKPQEVIDALGIEPGMRVGQWWPEDTFFLERLAERVGQDGRVYAIAPRPGRAEAIREILPEVEITGEPPNDLHALLILLLRAADQDPKVLEKAFELSHRHLRRGGRIGLIGVGSDRVRGFIDTAAAIGAARRAGLSPIAEKNTLKPQFFLTLEK